MSWQSCSMLLNSHCFIYLFCFPPPPLDSINALVDQEVKRRLFEEKVEREKQRRLEREKERQEREKEIHKLKSIHEKELQLLRAKLENR